MHCTNPHLLYLLFFTLLAARVSMHYAGHPWIFLYGWFHDYILWSKMNFTSLIIILHCVTTPSYSVFDVAAHSSRSLSVWRFPRTDHNSSFLADRSSEKVFGSNSGWLFTDAAESLFVVSISLLWYFLCSCTAAFSLRLTDTVVELILKRQLRFITLSRLAKLCDRSFHHSFCHFVNCSVYEQDNSRMH